MLFAGVSYFIRQNDSKELNNQNRVNKFCKKLHEKEVLLNTILEKAISDLKAKDPNTLNKDSKYFEEKYKKSDIAIVVSKNDSIAYWSSNSVPVEDIIVDTLNISEIFHLSNGWYEVREKKYNDFIVRGAILIKQEYNYQNDYLSTSFQKDFSLPDNCEIQLTEGEFNVFSSEGYLLCSLLFKTNISNNENTEHITIICFILSFIFFISFLILLLKNVLKKLSYLLITSILIFGIRYVFFKFKIPFFIYSIDIFTPKYYASSSLFPSLGDLLLNIICIFFISLIILKFFRTQKVNIKKDSKLFSIILPTILFFIITVLFAGVYFVIKGLIINSNLIFDLNNVLGINFYSVIGLIIISFVLLTFFLLTYVLSEKAFIISNKNVYKFYLSLFISLLVFCFINFAFYLIEWYYLLTPLMLVSVIAIYLKKDNFKFTVKAIITYIIIFSLFTTYCFFEYNTFKEKEKRKFLATQLSIAQDPIAEYMFGDVEKKIENDTLIKNIINSNSDNKEDQVTGIIKKNYMNGYWSKYNFLVVVCDPGEILNVKPDNIKTNCDTFFQNMINNIGIATMNKNFYFLNNGSGNNSYLAKIPYYLNANDSIHSSYMYLELDLKFIDKDLGYPELLINKDIKVNKDLYNYSYAKYKNNQLVLQYGKFYYNLNPANYNLSNDEYSFFEKGGYNHLAYKMNPSEVILISKKSQTALYVIAPFSYIFIFYCLSVIIFLLLYNFPLKRKEIIINFKTRIQISMVLVLFVSFIIIGATTLYYIINLYDKKNVDNISEKTHSVLTEIESKLGNVKRITPDMKENIEDILTRFQNIFFTDINIYTPGGILIASSSPQVFDEGMMSRKMDSKAFNELSTDNKTLYIHEENIGKLNYISAYVPFRNNNNELIGYINLPYFAKQSELKKELSTFFIAFININVILIALAVIIALLVANYITRPMKLIKDKLGQIKLGRKNEKIDWVRNDEIGGLINDYNRMIDELTESAELLARSERESAWREMAKQIAHEIKNPLTPMKLNIQLLKKSWDDKTTDWESRFEKFSKIMIEQIDSLSKIASEFSDFAKMPKANNEIIDVVSIIENTVVLYQGNNKTINFVNNENIQCFIFADRTQILRVLNNLIKNAVQAISENASGKIEINISKENDNFKITISDNGIGISEEQKDKIFSPNFTTKTGGMGLGLAMVKSIVESYEGKIWFESKRGEGTTFFVTLPVSENID